MSCDIFWGSHGCDLDLGHEGLHVCRSCCDFMEKPHDHTGAPDDYGYEGCGGNWPYYGSRNMTGMTQHGLGFFRYKAPDWEFEYLPDEWERMREIAQASEDSIRAELDRLPWTQEELFMRHEALRAVLNLCDEEHSYECCQRLAEEVRCAIAEKLGVS